LHCALRNERAIDSPRCSFPLLRVTEFSQILREALQCRDVPCGFLKFAIAKMELP